MVFYLRGERQTGVQSLVWHAHKADSDSNSASPEPHNRFLNPLKVFLSLSVLRSGGAGSGHLPAGGLQDDGTDAQPGVWQHSDHLWHRHHLCVLLGVPGSSEGESLPPDHGRAPCDRLVTSFQQ